MCAPRVQYTQGTAVKPATCGHENSLLCFHIVTLSRTLLRLTSALILRKVSTKKMALRLNLAANSVLTHCLLCHQVTRLVFRLGNLVTTNFRFPARRV